MQLVPKILIYAATLNLAEALHSSAFQSVVKDSLNAISEKIKF